MFDKYNKNETKTTVNILIQIKPQGKKTIIIFYYFILIFLQQQVHGQFNPNITTENI